MSSRILLLIVITIIICLYIYFTERFENGTMRIDDVVSQFDNISVYNNEDSKDGTYAEIGYDKCMKRCEGYCVEYGMTGTAFCYPMSKK